jgi:hypothetical protein
MEENLGKDEQEKKMEEIAEQDWPLLRELESTRFSLKNKKGPSRARQSLQAVKEVTEKEDQIISEQNIEDEKLVEAFLSVKPSNDNLSVELPTLIEDEDPSLEVVKEEPVVQASVAPVETIKEVIIHKEEVSPSVAPQPVVQPVQVINHAQPIEVQPSVIVKEKSEQNEELSKLIARGMAKTYISKTDSILNPLRFIISNSKQIGVALIQFIIPAIITWYLTTNVQVIAKELSKEAMHVYIVYTLIFYFACLFLWISGQVLFGGLWNLLKQAMANLAKVGKG